ncbi:MAG: helix-turn-helix transcriptional regulator [Prevotella sp.]
MSHSQYAKQLDLLAMLIDGDSHTAGELCQVLGTTRRNLYYYFSFLRDYGFELVRTSGGKYYIGPRSPFFRNIARSVDFTSQEVSYLFSLLAGTGDKSPLQHSVKRKLERFYGLSGFVDDATRRRVTSHAEILNKAIDQRKIVLLKDYSSPHSKTVSTRVVEPFLFLNEQADIRCYELSSHTNKTFKLSRIGSVVITDADWAFADSHKQVYTDIFLFSGDTRHHVSLRMGQLSHNLMLEEYPQSEKCFSKEDDSHWLFTTDVVSYLGIGRFVLGLFSDIQIIGDEGFKMYVRNVLKDMKL